MDAGADGRDRLDGAPDRELIEAARQSTGAAAERYLGILYRRHYRRVSYWCLKICGNPEEAADLAQEVFLRVHSRLDSFRLDSAFTTWLYTVTRSVAINRGQAARRRPIDLSGDVEPQEPVEPAPNASEELDRSETLARVRDVMERHLDTLEARVLYLHYAGEMTLPAITRLLALDNKSGAKAYIVSGIRKLKRHLAADAGGGDRSVEKT